jgi:hypothetical protein
MEDLEVSPAWLQGLHDLNSVIAATGQPLYGNLFYDDQQPDFADRLPAAPACSKWGSTAVTRRTWP